MFSGCMQQYQGTDLRLHPMLGPVVEAHQEGVRQAVEVQMVHGTDRYARTLETVLIPANLLEEATLQYF